VVPDAVIQDFSRALGVNAADGSDMDVDDGKVEGFDRVNKKVKELMRQGYSGSQILSQVSGPPEMGGTG
jgi:replication factor C subunit 2/4